MSLLASECPHLIQSVLTTDFHSLLTTTSLHRIEEEEIAVSGTYRCDRKIAPVSASHGRLYLRRPTVEVRGTHIGPAVRLSFSQSPHKTTLTSIQSSGFSVHTWIKQAFVHANMLLVVSPPTATRIDDWQSQELLTEAVFYSRTVLPTSILSTPCALGLKCAQGVDRFIFAA
jgi:hypothetical protein